MKAEELRIGNWVRTHEYRGSFSQHIITSISEDDYSVLPFICTEETNWESLEYIAHHVVEPIPLTEEWFIKLGGEKELYQDDEDDYYLVTRHKDFDFIYENDATVFCDIAGVVIPLKYVHQLQNLYHALTGEELKTIEKSNEDYCDKCGELKEINGVSGYCDDCRPKNR